jgi:hypothetical protein
MKRYSEVDRIGIFGAAGGTIAANGKMPAIK